ncbi:hypothetical protein BX589_10175 [Paraburkholderia fungorum]|jgi:hypothetical protein|uniref:hypothetical protein n=1 Tax=Paraburkholderia fungorum TaxID=134537 RepID=UPI000D05C0F1|nr:hypothetical protein [Paraburkholderia fungorum]PRZ56425.1 hypothetical protein BX589_10175 [Paraburkholderia fungorum]
MGAQEKVATAEHEGSEFLFDEMRERMAPDFDKYLEGVRDAILTGRAMHLANYNEQALALIAKAFDDPSPALLLDARAALQTIFWDVREAMDGTQLDFHGELIGIRDELVQGTLGDELTDDGREAAIAEATEWIGDELDEDDEED